MTLNQFLVISAAHDDREEDEWDRTANIMASVMNFAGLGASDPISPQDIFELRKYQEEKIVPISSWDEARELISEMEWQG